VYSEQSIIYFILADVFQHGRVVSTVSSVDCVVCCSVTIVFVQNKSNIELEMKTWKQNYEQEKLSHEDDLARFNAVKKDLIVSKEEANMEALKGQTNTCC